MPHIEERCHPNCEPKGQCYICSKILCAHKVIEHLDKGHIIWPVPYHIRFNPIFDEEERVFECNQDILDEVWEMSTRKIIELQHLEEEIDNSLYVTKDPFTIHQVREKVDALESISELLSRLNNQIDELTVRFLRDVVISCSDDNTIRIWEDSQSKVLAGHTKSINSVAVSQEKGILVSGSSDSTIRGGV